MKKLFLNFSNVMYLFSLILIITLSSCGGGGGSDSNDKPRWTIMVYVAADNDLSLYASFDIDEMTYGINDDGNVTIIALCDQDENSDTKLHKIKSYSTEQLFDPTLGVTSNSSELNMGDPQTLSKFIDFCKNNYPADNYALVLWNHGGGWRNKMPQKISSYNLESIQQYIADKKLKSTTTKSSLSTLLAKKTTLPVKAVCWDVINNDYLTMAEVKQAVSGKGLTVIGFDACLMGMVEVAYQLKDCAQYMVASEETIPGFGWAYDYLLQKFYASTQSPVDLGKAIINGYKEFYEEYGEDGVTLSLIDLSKMDALANAIDTFASSLQSQADKNIITAARHKTLCFTVPHYIDLYHFAQNASSFTGASDVMQALQNAVVYHQYLDDSGEYGFENSHGLSIYFPVNNDYDSEYNDYNSSNIDFAQKSWDEHLVNYFANVTKHTIETFPNGGSDDVDTYIVVFYYNNGTLNYLWEDDDSGSNLYSKISMPLAPGSRYYILCLDYWGYLGYLGNYGYYSILVNEDGGGSSSSIPQTNDYEPDDTWEQANQINYNTVYNYYLSPDDYDWMYIIIP
jgi:hypothetical protein